MIYIAHRGNTRGKDLDLENTRPYLELALRMGFSVECDVWAVGETLYLGHDEPLHPVDKEFLRNRKVWTHCKNVGALHMLRNDNVNCFFHQNDDYVLTSQGYIWCFPGKPVPPSGICVLPERDGLDIPDGIAGVCSDYIANFKS